MSRLDEIRERVARERAWRPHKISLPVPEGEIISWNCAACGEWVSEYREETPCSVDWRGPSETEWLLAEVDRLSDEKQRLSERAATDLRDMEIERNMLRSTLRDVLDRAEVAEAIVARVEALKDEGAEYPHNGHEPDEGEPECPACWVQDISSALRGDDQ